MNEEEEYLFQKSNSCWICKKLIDNDNEKVRDHCHVTGKFRGAAHQGCNINFQLTKKVFCELDKFNIKIDVIPNGLEKYMTFFLNKNLLLIDSTQFMNSSHNKLVKNLSDKGFKYLVEEFCSENLKILKQKGAYPYEYMNNFERLCEEKLPARKHFFSSTKKERLIMMVKYQTVT